MYLMHITTEEMIKHPIHECCPYTYVLGCEHDIVMDVCSFRYKIEIITELEIKWSNWGEHTYIYIYTICRDELTLYVSTPLI